MQLLVRFDSSVAIYINYNKVCKMERDWLKNKARQPTEIPDLLLRKGNIVLSNKYCTATVDYCCISWDGEHSEKTQEMKGTFSKYLTWQKRGTQYTTGEGENLSEYQMLSTGHSESNRNSSQQKRCLIMAKAKWKKENNKLVIFNHSASFQSPDSKIIMKEIRMKTLFPN